MNLRSLFSLSILISLSTGVFAQLNLAVEDTASAGPLTLAKLELENGFGELKFGFLPTNRILKDKMEKVEYPDLELAYRAINPYHPYFDKTAAKYELYKLKETSVTQSWFKIGNLKMNEIVLIYSKGKMVAINFIQYNTFGLYNELIKIYGPATREVLNEKDKFIGPYKFWGTETIGMSFTSTLGFPGKYNICMMYMKTPAQLEAVRIMREQHAIAEMLRIDKIKCEKEEQMVCDRIAMLIELDEVAARKKAAQPPSQAN